MVLTKRSAASGDENGHQHAHRGQTSEHAREIARGSHRSILKTLYVAVTTAASSCELEAKYSCFGRTPNFLLPLVLRAQLPYVRFYFNEVYWR